MNSSSSKSISKDKKSLFSKHSDISIQGRIEKVKEDIQETRTNIKSQTGIIIKEIESIEKEHSDEEIISEDSQNTKKDNNNNNIEKNIHKKESKNKEKNKINVNEENKISKKKGKSQASVEKSNKLKKTLASFIISNHAILEILSQQVSILEKDVETLRKEYSSIIMNKSLYPNYYNSEYNPNYIPTPFNNFIISEQKKKSKSTENKTNNAEKTIIVNI
jgi:hypothetical protein